MKGAKTIRIITFITLIFCVTIDVEIKLKKIFNSDSNSLPSGIKSKNSLYRIQYIGYKKYSIEYVLPNYNQELKNNPVSSESCRLLKIESKNSSFLFNMTVFLAYYADLKLHPEHYNKMFLYFLTFGVLGISGLIILIIIIYKFLNKKFNGRVHSLSETNFDLEKKRIELEKIIGEHSKEIRKRLIYEDAISQCSQALLTDEEKISTLKSIAGILGNILENCCLFVFENYENSNNEVYSHSLVKYCPLEKKVIECKPDEYVFHFNHEQKHWAEKLAAGEIIQVNTEDWLMKITKNQFFNEVLSIPILFSKEWFGFLLFEHNKENPNFINEDIRVIKTISELLAAYFSRKKMEIRFEESEAKFRTVVEEATDCIVIFDFLSTNILYANNKAVDLLGYNIEELHQMKIEEIHPDTLSGKELIRNRLKLRQSGERLPENFKSQVISKNNDIIDVVISTSNIIFGQHRAVLGIIKDISELEEARTALAEAEERFFSVVDNAWDVIALYTQENYQCVYVNKIVETITHYTKEEFKLLSIESIIAQTPENIQIIQEALKKRKTQPESRIEFEVQIKTKNGEILDCIFNTFPIMIKKINYIVIFGKDVTQRNKTIKEKAALIEASPNAIFVCNHQGIIVFASQKADELFDCSNGELEGINFIDLFYTNEKESAKILLSDSFAEKKISRRDYKLKSFTGEPFYGQLNITLVKGNTVEENSIILVIQDITIEKLSRDLLKSSEEKFKLLFNIGNDAIFVTHIIDNEIRILEVNEVAEQLYGYTREEFLRLPRNNFSSDFLQNIKKELFINGKYECEAEHSRKDGTVFPVEIRSKLFYYNDSTMIISVIRDISERKHAEDEIRLLSLAVSQSANSIFIRNMKGEIIYANSSFEKLIGYSLEEMKKMMQSDSPTEQNESFYNFFNTLLSIPVSEDKESINEIKGAHKSGSVFWAAMITTPVKLENGEIYSYITILDDITSIRNLAEEREELILELQKANFDLKALSKMKDDFLAVASHDLRAPFSGILGFAELLLEDGSLSETHRSSVELILESANAQLVYVNDLLDVIKFEYGNVKLNFEPVNINEIIRKTAEHFRVLAHKKSIVIHQDFKVKNIVYADPAKITQVLNNLIGNAIKFTHNNGEITLKSYSTDNGFYEVHVIDNGIGIPLDQMGNLFNKYQQVHTAGTNDEKGTGLGLSICKNLIELHGGTISVKSAPEKGSDFFFILPENKPSVSEKN